MSTTEDLSLGGWDDADYDETDWADLDYDGPDPDEDYYRLEQERVGAGNCIGCAMSMELHEYVVTEDGYGREREGYVCPSGDFDDLSEEMQDRLFATILSILGRLGCTSVNTRPTQRLGRVSGSLAARIGTVPWRGSN